MATANDVLKVARSQLGYKETPSGSNKTKYGKEYGMNGVAWCAEFVWWVFKHAGASKLFYGGGKCAYCPTIADYYIAKKQTVSKSSGKGGDIVLFGFGHTNSQHIGIIESKNSDGTYNCIEGNTSTGNNCNGGMVMRRKRYQSQINWIVRPKYAAIKAVDKPSGTYDGDIPKPMLLYGSQGSETKKLQSFLNWYHPAWKLTVDGEFGTSTDNALRIFQKTEGIDVDGEYGKASQAKAKAYKPSDSVTETGSVETVETVETSSKYTGTLPDLTLHARQMIGHTARNLAYAKNTTKATYTYPKGKAKEAFRKAINKVYPNRSGWSAQCRAGASCDVGAGTCIRFSGYDTTIPRGLAEQIPHLKKSKLWKKTSIKKGADMKYGDVGVYSGNGGHIWISLGGKLLCEANHTAKYFEHVVSKNIGKGNHTYFAVFRACKPMNIGYGDEGTEVTKLQKFLKWYGYDITPTGKYGDKTKEYVVQFQTENGLTATGEVGSKTLKKMKEAKK